jgi:SAM-dependent methyltransferase
MELLAQLKDLAPWHFDLEVAEGVRTSDGNKDDYENDDHQHVSVINPFELEPLLRRIYPEGLAGKRFLDVGCNAGGYCFLAKKLGAASTFGFDIHDHWIRQANFLKETLDIDKRGIGFAVMHLGDLDASKTADITLFKGVFYHIPDPIHDLRCLCDLTQELLILDTMTDPTIPEHCLGSYRESQTHLMSGVDGLRWVPGGPKVVEDILRWGGFTDIRLINQRKEYGDGRRGRIRLVAARSADLLKTFAVPDETDSQAEA